MNSHSPWWHTLESHASRFAGLIVILSLAVYLPSLGGGFFSDDLLYVAENDALKDIPLHEIWKLFFAQVNVYEYLPVRDLSYRIDIALFGAQPWGYHLHNLILYGLACCSVWFCTLAVLSLLHGGSGPQDRLFAAVVTAFFAAHPAHVESVAWISGRKDLLSGLFSVLAIWQFTKARQPAGWHLRRLAAATLFFLLAIFSKGTVVSLPLLLFLLAGMPVAGQKASLNTGLRAAAVTLPFFLIALLGVMISLNVGSETGVKMTNFNAYLIESDGILYSLLSAALILGYLVRIALAPFHLRLLYDVGEPGVDYWLAIGLSFVTVVCLVVALLRVYRRPSPAALGVCLFVIFSLPYLQFIPFVTWSFASERFLFISVLGVAFVAATLFREPGLKSVTALVIVLVAFLAISLDRAREWGHQTPGKVLFLSNLEYSDGAAFHVITNNYLPEGKIDQAKKAAAKMKQPKMKQIMLALIDAYLAQSSRDLAVVRRTRERLVPYIGRDSNPYTLNILANLYTKEGNYFEAARYYYRIRNLNPHAKSELEAVWQRVAPKVGSLKRAIADNPSDLGSRMTLAGLFMKSYQLDQARQEYLEILGRVKRPGERAVVNYNLGLTALRGGEFQEASDRMEQALEGGIRTADLLNSLGLANQELGAVEKAEAYFTDATNTDPLYYKSAFNLGLMQGSMGEEEKALKSFLEARKRMAAGGESTDFVDQNIQLIREKE